MEMEDFKTSYYFFNLKDYGDIYTFVDFGNVRPWADDFWQEENKYKRSIEIDIEKLAYVCDLVKPEKKFFYYGHFGEGHSQHKSSIFRIDKARKSRFVVKTKEVKMIPDYKEDGTYNGKRPKCNFDVEMTMDILTKMPKYDTIMLFSGDSDFGGLLQYVKNKGKKVVVVCTRKRLSTELQSVADVVIPAETLSTMLGYKKTLRQ